MKQSNSIEKIKLKDPEMAIKKLKQESKDMKQNF
jgi:hypothetical protein